LSSLLLRRRKSVATGCHSRVNIDVLNYLLVKLSLFYYLARAYFIVRFLQKLGTIDLDLDPEFLRNRLILILFDMLCGQYFSPTIIASQIRNGIKFKLPGHLSVSHVASHADVHSRYVILIFHVDFIH
jgi:hypothetical protein